MDSGDIITFSVNSPVDDKALSELHHRALGPGNGVVLPWCDQLQRHSLAWVQAERAGTLIGFINTCWDGGQHAFVLDTVVDPQHQRRGVRRELVRRAALVAQDAGCAWLHVDFEPLLAAFYVDACGFQPTAAAFLD